MKNPFGQLANRKSLVQSAFAVISILGHKVKLSCLKPLIKPRSESTAE